MTTSPVPHPVRLLNLGSVPSWQTQAIYHALAEMMTSDSPDTIVICQPQTPYLCLGYHQIYDHTFDRAECERRNLPVFRRRVGGGATYLDKNQLFYQCIFHHSRVPFMAKDVYAQMLAAPVATLDRLGLQAGLRAVNEVEANGQRIAGIGGGRIGEASVVVGNLLFDFDYEVMTQVWYAPWSLFRELASTALRERVITLQQLLGQVTMEEVTTILLEEFPKALDRPLQASQLTEAELSHAQHVAERLSSPEYLALHQENGQPPVLRPLKIAAGVFIHADQIEFEGYQVRASFRVHDKVIETACLESNPVKAWGDVENTLQGALFTQWKEQFLTLSNTS